MSETTNENESEFAQLSEQDMEDLKALGVEAPQVSLLRIWTEVLSNIEAFASQKLPMGVAGKIVAGWPQISFQETQHYHDLYHDYLMDVRTLLEAEIEDHPGAIEHMEPDDMAENYDIYRTLVIRWNIMFDEHEQAWDSTAEDSHVKYAALVDARGFVFGETGFAGHLGARQFSMPTEEVYEALRIARGEQ